MAKITLENGMVIEGSIEELTEMAKAFGGNVEVPAVEIDGVDYRKVTDGKPKAGDYFKFTDVGDHDDVTAGKYYEIVEVDSDGDLNFYDDVDDFHNAVIEDVEVYEKVAPCCANPEPLKVGDYARVVNYPCPSVFSRNIVKVTDINRKYTSFPLRAELLDGSDDEVFSVNQLVRATDEEVAEAKKESERMVLERRWAKIGRKPNEFKKGDIIKDTDGIFGFHYCEVLTAYSDYLRCTGGVDIHVPNAKLITPAETRFDREKDALA